MKLQLPVFHLLRTVGILSLLILCHSLFSQAPVIEWQNTIGGIGNDYLYSLQQTNDGGYILGGTSKSNISGDKTENKIGLEDYWIMKIDSVGNIQWQNTIGGTDEDWLYSLWQTSDGGYILGGYSRSDISGDKTENSIGEDGYWIVKLDSVGNIEWQNTIGGNSYDFLYSIQQTSDGGYILGGSSYSNSSGDKTENCNGILDYWIIKTDSLGNILWQNTIGGSQYDRISTIQQSNDGGYILGGLSTSDISGDKTENTDGYSDYWIVKADAAGNIQWDHSIGGSDSENFGCIRQTSDGGYILGGTSLSNISGDKTENSNGTADYWIVKTDASGNIQWDNSIGGSTEDYLLSLQQTSDGGYILGGYSNSNISGDKSESSGGYYPDYWILKTDVLGNVQWDNTIGGNNYDELYSIQQTNDGGYILGGYSNSNISGDKTENSWNNSEDYWIVKLTDNYNLITGDLFLDFNSNLVQDAGEPDVVNHTVTEINTGNFSFSQLAGIYYVPLFDTGNFTISSAAINYYNAVPATHNAYFSGFLQIDSLNDFAFQPTGVFNDLAVTITPLGPFRPGFDASYMIDYINVGTTSLSGSVVFYPHPILSYLSSSVAPSLITADSVMWNIATLAPFESGSIIVTVNVSTSAIIGSEITSGVKIVPVAGDADPINNYSEWRVTITGSFDPNEILVDIDTVFTYQLVNPSFLEYIIYFQNTGTDTAFNVKVFNKIPSTLDLASIEFVNSSHPMEIRFNYFIDEMEFHFDNILLPDSNVNEPESHGYVRYRTKPLSTLVAGDTVINNARIFFDFNAPVLTNDANTFIELLTSIESAEMNNQELRIYPNPADELLTIEVKEFSATDKIVITDITGRQSFTYSFKNKIAINTSHFPKGMYLVKAVNENGEVADVKKVVVQ